MGHLRKVGVGAGTLLILIAFSLFSTMEESASLEIPSGMTGPPSDMEQSALSPSPVKPQQMFPRKDLLGDYIKLHADIVSGRAPPRFLRWSCSSPMCPGWGDRLRGIMNTLVVGILTNRAVLIDQSRVNLLPYYRTDVINYAFKVPEGTPEPLLDCGGMYMCPCTANLVAHSRGEDPYVSHIGMSWCFEGLMTDPALDEARELLFKHLGEDAPSWRTIFFETFFKPTPLLDSLIDEIWKPSPNSVGIHIRSGMMGPDQNRFPGTLEEYLADFASCAVTGTESFPEPPLEIFVACDNTEVTAKFIEVATDSFKKKGKTPKFVTGEAAGGLEHVAYSHSGDSESRMFAEFEVLRRVELLLPSESGYSFMAYVVRERFENRNLVPSRKCVLVNEGEMIR